MNSDRDTLQRDAEAEFYRRIEADHESVSVDKTVDVLAAERRIDEFWLRALRLVASYSGDQFMALDCLFLLLGQTDLCGATSAIEIAIKRYGDPKRKAAVSKCIQMFRDSLDLPAAPGQRSDDGRKAMSEARNKQLETIKEKP